MQLIPKKEDEHYSNVLTRKLDVPKYLETLLFTELTVVEETTVKTLRELLDQKEGQELKDLEERIRVLREWRGVALDANVPSEK